MNYSQFEKEKVFFVGVDAAAQNTIYSILQELLMKGWKPQDFFVFTNKEGVVPADLLPFVKVIEFQKDAIQKELQSINPSLVFLGTSVGNQEWNWIKISNELGIQTLSFIDYWSNYRNRYLHDGELILPSEILVLNHKAKMEAIAEGLPENLLRIVRNPYYSLVEQFVPEISKIDFLKKSGLSELPTIVFVSDDIKRNNLNLGFDEYTILSAVLQELMVVLDSSRFTAFNFVIKLHPRDVRGKFRSIIDLCTSNKLIITEIHEVDSKVLNYYANYVVGMFSNMVIEALLLNKKVLRVEINQKIELFNFDERSCALVLRREALNAALFNFLTND